jgi:protein O-GlcNAc transferase
VSAERVELFAKRPNWAAHLALYDRIGIALDPLPYNSHYHHLRGVVDGRAGRDAPGWPPCQPGRRRSSDPIHLPDLIAETMSEYADIAAALARDPARLNGLRSSLRSRAAASPL